MSETMYEELEANVTKNDMYLIACINMNNTDFIK